MAISSSVELIEAAIFRCLPFKIGYTREDLERFPTDLSMSRVQQWLAKSSKTGSSSVEPRIDIRALGGDYLNQYFKAFNIIMQRPHMVAALGVGGGVTWVVSRMRPDIFARFKEGPSTLLRTYTLGDSDGRLYKDEISQTEKDIIYGRSLASAPIDDRYLFPPPLVLSRYTRMGPEENGWMDKAEIIYQRQWQLIEDQKAEAWTAAQWRNNLRLWTKDTPEIKVLNLKEEDWNYGRRLLNLGYPSRLDGENLEDMIWPLPFHGRNEDF
ncbi:hypothetical protein C8J56DRAFT_1049556 [Mycena floridula]|nr:hypothetical protein C8J56DRAFT_1049556 [Mycena floridula]